MLRPINRRQFLKFSAGADAAIPVANTAAFAVKKNSSAFSSASLVGYWKLGEGTASSVSDASRNNFTGALQSGATWTNGQVGSHALSVTE